jgi:hypothetical protein
MELWAGGTPRGGERRGAKRRSPGFALHKPLGLIVLTCTGGFTSPIAIPESSYLSRKRHLIAPHCLFAQRSPHRHCNATAMGWPGLVTPPKIIHVRALRGVPAAQDQEQMETKGPCLARDPSLIRGAKPIDARARTSIQVQVQYQPSSEEKSSFIYW